MRAEGKPIGYLGSPDAAAWAGVLRRIVASGFVPTTSCRIYAYEYDGWDGVDFRPNVRIALGDPAEALPINDPPAVPYTLLPSSSFVQVTKEDEHFDVLSRFVPASGHGVLVVTLHERQPEGRAKAHVEVRIDDERIGQLTPQTSQRFLPLIRHLRDRGLLTACRGDITGSALAAEVRVDGIKANEATAQVLDGPAVTIPPLVPEQSDPSLYDLTAMAALLKPLPIVQPVIPPVPDEPPDGSVVRFTKRGRYCYAAVRRGQYWETTATGDWGSISQRMIWRELAPRMGQFEVATGWSAVETGGDLRVRQHRSVVRFTLRGLDLAAVNISKTGGYEGEWYTTISDDVEDRLPFGDYAVWSDITEHGEHVEVVTEWTQRLAEERPAEATELYSQGDTSGVDRRIAELDASLSQLTHDFAVILPELCEQRSNVPVIYEAMCSNREIPAAGAADAVAAFVGELRHRYGLDHDGSDGALRGCEPDARGTIVSVSNGLASIVAPLLLETARDHDLAVYDPQLLRLYDPRDRIDLDAQVGGDTLIPFVTERLIPELFGTLDPEEPFIIFARADEVYMQVYVEAGEPVVVEYRDGGEDRHFHAETEDSQLVQRVIWDWATNRSDWRDHLEWERMDFD
ncbi:hypothetical protein [Mycolicibacterium monacense]|uniref:hypothetical protein n=1 Tax=Mycolicibacterium monacense TaxID=85693 RepID=UPI00104203EC|nr:hypothetical protein [Mycolicibacterium monacense]